MPLDPSSVTTAHHTISSQRHVTSNTRPTMIFALAAILPAFIGSAAATQYFNTGVHCGTTADATLSDCQALVNDQGIWDAGEYLQYPSSWGLVDVCGAHHQLGTPTISARTPTSSRPAACLLLRTTSRATATAGTSDPSVPLSITPGLI